MSEQVGSKKMDTGIGWFRGAGTFDACHWEKTDDIGKVVGTRSQIMLGVFLMFALVENLMVPVMNQLESLFHSLASQMILFCFSWERQNEGRVGNPRVLGGCWVSIRNGRCFCIDNNFPEKQRPDLCTDGGGRWDIGENLLDVQTAEAT